MRKPGSFGQAQGLDLKIMDDIGEFLPQDEIGEVCFSGSNVTSGYLRGDPQVVGSTFTKLEYLRTGDRGYMGNDGYRFLTGRTNELINKGGEKISPIEIDNLFAKHPSVLEDVSFAIDDELYGQDVAVAIALDDDCVISSAEGANVVLILGAPLNWMLPFRESIH